MKIMSKVVDFISGAAFAYTAGALLAMAFPCFMSGFSSTKS